MSEEVVRLYKLGLQINNIATLTGLTKSQVEIIVYQKNKLRRYNQMTSEKIKLINRLREQGLKIRSISDRTGYSENQVRYALYWKNEINS